MTDWSSAYAEHGTAVRAYLRRRAGPEEAEDLCQETFARALSASRPLRRAESVRAYLFQIAHNLLVNHLRRPRQWLRNESELGGGAALEELAGHEQRAEEQADARRLAERIDAYLLTLPEQRRRCFQMAAIEGRPYAEIANELGWTVPNVKIQVFRLRKLLIRMLPPESEGEGHAPE
ncbi:MAG TPA: sigma-70 family RNA polymerase sigma factor [Candidatus Krumholzibacteria bacterium]|jgi:RNA polymerase sigma-70 factor (ECF subfamily)